MNIIGHFIEAANKHPEAVAIVHKNKALTYFQLHNKVKKVAASLHKTGIQSGDNVMLMIPFSIDLYVNILGLFYVGARVVLVDAIKEREKVVYAFNKSECKAIITVPLIHKLRFLFFSKLLWKKFVQLKPTNNIALSPFVSDQTETALITFTTGSTGEPKAANRTHQFLTIQLDTLIEEMNIQAWDVHISSLPVVLMCNLAVGATSIIPPKDNWLQRKYWRLLQTNWAPTVVSASPFYVLYFNNHLRTELYRKVFIGGATILPNFIKKLASKITLDKVLLVYGSTEAEPMASTSAIDYIQKLDEEQGGVFVGTPHHNISLLIAKIDKEMVCKLDDGKIGEILVAGQHVLADYYKDAEAYAKNKIVYNGKTWHRTGDAGSIINEKLYFYGRLKYTWQENNIFYSPTCFEKWISIELPERNATLLRINNKQYAFIEGKKSEELVAAVAHSIYKIDEWISVTSLPRDNRHQSRINYEKLIKIVNAGV